MKKGMTLPVELLVVLIVAVIILLAVILFYYGGWKGKAAIDTQTALNMACGVVASNLCAQGAWDKTVTGVDLDQNNWDDSVAEICRSAGLEDWQACFARCGCTV